MFLPPGALDYYENKKLSQGYCKQQSPREGKVSGVPKYFEEEKIIRSFKGRGL